MTVLTFVVVALLGCRQPEETAVVQDMNCARLDTPDTPRPEDLEACFALGQAAMNQARPDIKRARTMYARACKVHHPPSCNALGEMVRDAKGGPRDPRRAAELFEIACKGDVQSACVNLGIAYYDGTGVKQDHTLAVQMFERACHHETSPQAAACSALGVAYQDGKGVDRKDPAKAEELQFAACDRDYAPGCVLAGTLYEKKPGNRKQHLAKATELLEKACKLDARFGCMEVAALHERGDAPESSDQKAAVFYQKTCNIDPTRGCFEAARLMEQGKVTAREGEIESLYNLACEHGHSEACSKRSLDL